MALEIATSCTNYETIVASNGGGTTTWEGSIEVTWWACDNRADGKKVEGCLFLQETKHLDQKGIAHKRLRVYCRNILQVRNSE